MSRAPGSASTIGLHWWLPPVAGLVFALAYPPLDLLPLAIIGPWPLLAFLEHADARRPLRAFVGGYLFGLAFFGAGLYWVAGLTGFTVMAVPAYVAVTMVLAFNGGLTAVGVALARQRGISVVIAFPLVWTAVEWLRSFGDLGFTWSMAGDTLSAYPLLIQPAELGGAYLLSLWLMAVSAGTYRLLRPRGRRRSAWTAAGVALLVLAVPVYGAVRLATLERAYDAWPTLRVAVIQPNIPQDVKWEASFEAETHRRLAALTLRGGETHPDLIVWPEAAVAGHLRYNSRSSALVTSLAARIDTPILTGTNDADTIPGRTGSSAADYRYYNAAYLVDGSGVTGERYAKRQLVPVAERVPFLPGVATDFFERLSSWTGAFTPGDAWTTWVVDGARFGVVICYELVFPGITRQLVLEGADFLVNITNDAWFGRSAAPYQHASHLPLRAVEHRISVVRSANTGISGWVDPLGRYRAATGLYSFAVVTGDVPMPRLQTLYTRWGDWVPITALGAWVAMIGIGRRRRGQDAT